MTILWPMNILVRFWEVYLATEPSTSILRSNLPHCTTLQPSHLAYARPVRCATPALARYALCVFTMHKPAHGQHGHDNDHGLEVENGIVA